jgi:hypothetical protein
MIAAAAGHPMAAGTGDRKRPTPRIHGLSDKILSDVIIDEIQRLRTAIDDLCARFSCA